MGWRKRVLLGFGITCVALLIAGLWLHRRLESHLPKSNDLVFLNSEAARAFREVQESLVYIGTTPTPKVVRTPQHKFEFDKPEEEVRRLIRDNLKGTNWMIREPKNPQEYFSAANRRESRDLWLSVRTNGKTTTVTVEVSGSEVNQFETVVLRQIWNWKGTDIKAGA